MTDKDLLPCPWCRGERVSTYEAEDLRNELYYVFCETCGMASPPQDTRDMARQVYNVVARLAKHIVLAMNKEAHLTGVALHEAGLEFIVGRNKYPAC